MAGFRRRFCWLVLITVYWSCALWLVFAAFRIYVDGGGPSASLSWGILPSTPTMVDHHWSMLHGCCHCTRIGLLPPS